jgi:hypothetical protein
VVVTVSVDVCAPAPVIATELGERLHVGGSLAATGLIEHVRFTVPVKPFDGVTVMVTVFPVVAPGSILIDELPPPIVNVGAGFTVRAMVVDAVRVPEVPVTVTVTGPPALAVLLAVSVNTLEPAVGFVAKLAVTPLGKPVADRVTEPVNPYAGVTVMLSVLLLP